MNNIVYLYGACSIHYSIFAIKLKWYIGFFLFKRVIDKTPFLIYKDLLWYSDISLNAISSYYFSPSRMILRVLFDQYDLWRGEGGL